MHIPAALCSNGTKSCYNRIILLIAALCLCHLGAPVNAVASMTSTLAQLRYHVRSAFGNLEQGQGQAEWTDPVAGIGQGNRAPPQIWVFEILRQEGFLATVICALSRHSQMMGGFAFVNDTDLIVTDASNNEEAVATKMQGSVSLWHGLLKATGGDLVPEKCFWYLINFRFENHQWKYKQWSEQLCTIHIPLEDGTYGRSMPHAGSQAGPRRQQRGRIQILTWNLSNIKATHGSGTPVAGGGRI